MDIFTRLMRPTREGHDKSTLLQSNIHDGADLNPNLPQASSALTRRIYQQEQLRNPRRRAIFKDGECNVLPAKTTKRQLRFLQDMFTSLVDIQWRFTLLAFMIAYFGSWLFFSLLWWLIAYTHGDLEEEHLPNLQAQNNWNPCVMNIYSWTSCFLYGFETQTTIGYGVRTITEECPQAIFVVQMQWMSAMVIDSFMIGVVFAKLTRPKLKRQTILFSKNAVISQRDGRLCFMFRVGDMSKTNIIGGNVRALLIRFRKTKEGEIFTTYQTELSLTVDGCESNLFLIWPMVILHEINEDSPLYHLSAKDLLQEHLEIVVLLEGTVESTGQSIQARSSYLNYEILWGYRFESIVKFNDDRIGYEVNFNKFNSVYPIDSLFCSAAEFDQTVDEEETLKLDKPLSPERPPRPATPQDEFYTNFAGVDYEYTSSYV